MTCRQPPPGLIHHTDRGSQYASHEYRALLDEHGLRCSMSAAGNCYDNAVAESFFATLKKELVHGCAFETRSEAYDAISDYIDQKRDALYGREEDTPYWRNSTRHPFAPNQREANALINQEYRTLTRQFLQDPEAFAEDGLIEAVRGPDETAFCLGVQWHPEWAAKSNPVSTVLFRRFGAAARGAAT